MAFYRQKFYFFKLALAAFQNTFIAINPETKNTSNHHNPNPALSLFLFIHPNTNHKSQCKPSHQNNNLQTPKHQPPATQTPNTIDMAIQHQSSHTK